MIIKGEKKQMRMRKIEMNARNISFIVIIIVCILALSYGIYYQIFGKRQKELKVPEPSKQIQDIAFEDLFDNKLNLQNYETAEYVNKLDVTKDIIYTSYTLNEIYEGKYEIQANIPMINIRHDKTIAMDRELLAIFYDKMGSIIENSKKEGTPKTIYTVDYTAYLNENILSLVIKANLKEGEKAQRTIIKTYTYNISTNEQINLSDLLEIKKINTNDVETQIKQTVEQAKKEADNLETMGYQVYKRDLKSDIYKAENVDNYFLGPNGSIYIIYAYGNTNFTTECDIIFIK